MGSTDTGAFVYKEPLYCQMVTFKHDTLSIICGNDDVDFHVAHEFQYLRMCFS